MNATERDSMEATIGASPQSGGLIWQTPTHWRMTAAGLERALPATLSSEELAEELNKLADQAGSHARRCVLAIPTTECFFVNVANEELGNAKDRSAVAFELERFFPLDAEEMVADFCSDKSRMAAVCIEAQRQRDAIESLESRGIDVASVVPASFLIARALTENRDVTGRFEVILQVGEGYESLLVDSEGVWEWKAFFAEEGLRQHLSLSEESSCPLVLVGSVELPIETKRSVTRVEHSAGKLAVRGVDLILAGQWGRWIELRRGALAPSDPLRAVAQPLRWLALTAAVCFILIALAASYRGQRISAAVSQIKDEQRAAFKKAFPDRRVPIMLARTIRSEHRRAMGARGKGDSIKLPIPATNVLRRLYAGLEKATTDAKARFRVLDLTVNDGECSLTVRARNSLDVGAIAKALESAGFQVQPPGSEQIEPSKEEPIVTYESTIIAQWIPKAGEREEAS